MGLELNMSMEVLQRPAYIQNYGSRKGAAIDTIVIHTMEASIESATNLFADPKAGCSAHYGIAKDGRVFQYVQESNAAWHCGNSIYNRRSIGIELEGKSADPKNFTDKMMEKLIPLTVEIMGRHKINLVVGHDKIPDPKNPKKKGGINHHIDPGPHFPWDSYMVMVALLGKGGKNG